MADYTTECGSAPLTFLQLLASTIRGYHDIGGNLHYRLNTLVSSNGCGELSDFLTCNTSHIEAERQLVENTFALDECNLLALKLFSDTDNDWEDYSVCGEVPKTFLEMLARCIVTYAGHARINAHIDTNVCTSLEDLLSCPNDIEAERMLVANLFAVDDCDKQLIKLFANTSTMTDYNVGCGELGQSFYQMLARCIVKYSGHYYLNVASVSGNCDDLHAFWTCANNQLSPESALVNSLFATDSCGHLAVKLFNNQGDAR
ncbi:MAG TPA: hypothetical protein VIJ25_08225 [Methylococcales bacterium]